MKNKLFLHNTITDKVELFVPINENEITMYVCGPTVYNRAHLGNARSVIIYDVLYRLLSKLFSKVRYVRNITDIDDKIIKAAIENKVSTKEISNKYTKFFHQDMAYLYCLNPTHEPKATEHIDDMINIIQKLIENKSAYYSNGAVYFSVSSFPEYGFLSRRTIDEQQSSGRIDENSDKKDHRDFVLWKTEPNETDAIYDSPWGKGRPGWHIECTAMTNASFGPNFDIHGGGGDLKFPHHENEIAQACCAHKNSHYAKYWVHNGFLMVNGEKMSKSLGNFVTIADLIDKKINGNIIRYALLSANYNQPLNWNDDLIKQSENNLNKITRLYKKFKNCEIVDNNLYPEFFDALINNLNTSKALMSLQTLANNVKENPILFSQLKNSFEFLGFKIEELISENNIDENEINEMIEKRRIAKINKNFSEADVIRKKLDNEMGIIINDNKDGTTSWEFK